MTFNSSMYRKLLTRAQKAHPAALDRRGWCSCVRTFAMISFYIKVKNSENFNSWGWVNDQIKTNLFTSTTHKNTTIQMEKSIIQYEVPGLWKCGFLGTVTQQQQVKVWDFSFFFNLENLTASPFLHYLLFPLLLLSTFVFLYFLSLLVSASGAIFLLLLYPSFSTPSFFTL